MLSGKFRNYLSNLVPNVSSSGILPGILSPDYSGAYSTLESADKYALPYYGAGLASLATSLPLEAFMSVAPQASVNRIMSGYTESPYAQYQTNVLTNAANQQAALAGDLGTPNEQYDLANQLQGVVSKDEQQYLRNVQDTRNTGLSGLSSMTSLGANMADQLMRSNNVIAALQAAQAGQGLSGLYGLLGAGTNFLTNL